MISRYTHSFSYSSLLQNRIGGDGTHWDPQQHNNMASINETNRSKRRRIDDDDDNDDDEEEEDDDVSSPISASPLNDSRQARLERRAAERRARAAAASSQQQHDDDNNEPPLFPGDNHYQGAVENDTEPVPDDELYVEDEEEDGEDLLDNAERDYQRIAALDTYGTEGLDDAEYEEMDIDERRAVEQVLAKRDEEQGKSRNDGFYGMLDEYEQEEDEDARKERRKRWEREQEEEEEKEEESDDDLEAEDQVNLEAFDVPLREWIAQNRTRYVIFLIIGILVFRLVSSLILNSLFLTTIARKFNASFEFSSKTFRKMMLRLVVVAMACTKPKFVTCVRPI
jgi:hypothetical protein